MKKIVRRMALFALALTLLAAAVLPAALAAEQAVPKGASFTKESMTTYTGMKTSLTVYDLDGNAMKATDYKWSSANKKIVKVSSGGVVTAMKPGKAKITAVSKTNKKNKAVITVQVKKNKLDKINSKPSYKSAKKGYINVVLKSIEIKSPSKVAVTYYVAWNNKSSYRSVKIDVADVITAWDEDAYKTITIVDGKKKGTKLSMKGKQVKKVTVTFKGSRVKNTNLCLKDYKGNIKHNVTDASLWYYK